MQYKKKDMEGKGLHEKDKDIEDKENIKMKDQECKEVHAKDVECKKSHK